MNGGRKREADIRFKLKLPALTGPTQKSMICEVIIFPMTFRLQYH